MFFEGSYVALVTPFKENGCIDEEKLRELVNFHIENGTNGISPCGTTGESPTLSHEEHKRIIEIVVDEVKGRIQVIAGAGSNSTKEAIEFTKHAKEVGADAVLSIGPYYNKPGQRGYIEHFKAIANAVNIPIMLYNVPGRTAQNMTPETIYELSKIDNIKGVKEASGSLEQVCEILNLCEDKIDVISGDDPLLLPMLSVGAKGIVSVTANILPREVSNIIKYFNEGDIASAQKIHQKLFKLNQNMFIETNPVPVKAVMEMLGKINGAVRLPLVGISDESKNTLQNILKKLELV
ncbi:MAG: 4-hydroxy-tetrahydrodipicolinate synthase [Fusobacteria bacterium]|nr:4-hydroxy-tetrahydrodipicolinate synthase [Fusobacteriota bacterium]